MSDYVGDCLGRNTHLVVSRDVNTNTWVRGPIKAWAGLNSIPAGIGFFTLKGKTLINSESSQLLGFEPNM